LAISLIFINKHLDCLECRFEFVAKQFDSFADLGDRVVFRFGFDRFDSLYFFDNLYFFNRRFGNDFALGLILGFLDRFNVLALIFSC
jgi:hypothetical protein